MAPGLTWANGGWDGGDLITAAATGGIPHPTGYPLYLLLARLFQFLPFGSLAFRTNLMSAVFAVLASLLIYGTVTGYFFPARTHGTMLAGMTAGYCFGLSPLVWSQAVITEVYALQAFLVALIVVLYVKPSPVPDARSKAFDRWRGLVLGLAVGNHMTALLLVPAALLVGSFKKRLPSRNNGFDLPSLGRQFLGLGAGLCTYLILPLRAFGDSPVQWGNPVSLDRFWWLVSGELYQDVYLQVNLSNLWAQILFWMEFAVRQLGIPAVLLGLLGLIIFGNLSRLLLLTIWVAGTALFFVSVYRPADADVYLMPLLLSFALWLGLGVGSLIERLAQRSYTMGLGLGILMIGYILLRPVSYFRQVDASRDGLAESFGEAVLSAMPENAIVFAKGDQAIFALWYFHFALHKRPDLTVLATELLHYDWYQEVMRTTYPNLSLPDPFPYPETIARANAVRPTCHVQYADRTEIECAGPMAVSQP